MKIIYHCFGGSHSSVTAAAIHVGLLSSSAIPRGDQLMQVPYFDGQEKEDHGEFKYIGTDEFGNQVYVVGKRNLGEMFEPMMYGIGRLYGVSGKDVILVDTMPYVNWMMVVGGFLSRRLGLVRLGRPLVIWGTQQAFANFANMVETLKTKLRSGQVMAQ
ncbi:DUF3189 family protein [Calderihabitans maritimus]|uniref:DUF3189 family protein n=1 Tax=Calderihabitans maritimus TaxID=1246530 RepID=A0A1Z5HUN9_9FIRM|nr:DUF3189 family protein [Calderihabitans maritimus]GAW93234.1 hypothetical protein TherJR_1585 [Calderihabitans maritimus]